MKKIIVGLLFLLLFVGVGFMFISKADHSTIDPSYKVIGKVGDYTVYENKDVQFFAQALDYFYEDEQNKYYFNEMRSHIYLLYNGKEQLGLREALQTNKVNIDDLRKVIKNIHVEKK